MSRPGRPHVDAHREGVRPQRPHHEEPLDLVRAASGRPGSGSAGRPRDPGTSAGSRRRLSRTCRRRTTSVPSMCSGNQRRWSIASTLYHRAHAPLERGRRRRRGDDEDVREDGDPRRRTSPRSTPTTLPVAAVFLTGRPFPEADQRTIGVGWAGIAGAVLRVAGARRPDALGRAYDRSSDIATAVTEVLAEAGHAPDPAGEPTVRRGPGRVRGDRGGARARPPRPPSWRRCSRRSSPRARRARSSRCSAASCGSASARACSRRRSRRRSTARSTTSSAPGCSPATSAGPRRSPARTASATPRWPLFHPLKFMLASPAEDAAEIIGRLGPTVWVEDKYDGIRAQLHRAGDEVRLYSRDLHDISGQFPEVVEGARDLPWAGILDGELLAWKDGVVLPFLQLQARLGRKNPSATILARDPGDLRRVGRARARPRRRTPWSRPLLERAAHGAPRRRSKALAPAARRATADGSPSATSSRVDSVDGPGGGVRRGARAAQRGAHGQGPREPATRRAAAASAG